MRVLLGKTLPRAVSTLLDSQKQKFTNFLNAANFLTNNSLDNKNSITIQALTPEKISIPPPYSDIKLLSYNIFVRPPMINNNGNDFKDERLKEFLKASKTYDVICLQEIFGTWSNRKEKLIENAREAGFFYSASPSKPPALSHLLVDSGLLILSRYPIETFEFCPYPYGIGSDFFVEKGALYAKLNVGNAKLHLYTTHAQATYDDTMKYFLKRTEQFEVFQKFVKDTLIRNEYNPEDMVLFTGDFNVNGRSAHKFDSSHAEMNSMLQKFDNLIEKGSYSEYDALVNCLTNNTEDEIQDLLHGSYEEHPITFGDFYMTPDNQRKPKESVLTHKNSLCTAESLDYIFRYIPQGLPSKHHNLSKSKQSLVVKENSAAVERFLTFGNDFEQLSDHYGVRVTLQHKQNEQIDRATTASSSYFQPNMKHPIQLE